MLDLGEKEFLPLFKKEEDKRVDFLVISHGSLKYQEELLKRGYVKDESEDYDNVKHLLETKYVIELPE